jgi:hypothetical protein
MPCEFPDFLMKKVASRGYLPRLFRLQRGESRQWASAIRQDIQRWGMALPLRKKHSKEVAPADTERRSPWLVTRLERQPKISTCRQRYTPTIAHCSANHILTDGRHPSELLSGVPLGEDQ